MQLQAVNKTWAVYDDEDASVDFRPYEALRDLLGVKSYRQLLDFLIEHTANWAFADSADRPAYHPTYLDYRDRPDRPDKIELDGDLRHAIDLHPEVDYLDDLSIKDLVLKPTNELALSELLYFRSVMRRFLTLAAVALGARAPEGLFAELSTAELFGKQWCDDNLSCRASGAPTFGIAARDIPFDDNGLFSEEAFHEQGLIFAYKDAYEGGRTPFTDEVVERFAPAHRRKGPVCCDGVIYAVHERDRAGETLLTVTAVRGTEPDHAKRLFAGRIVETLLNCGINPQLSTLTRPDHGERKVDRYSYDGAAGFAENVPRRPKAWFETLYDEAVRLVLAGKVALCPVCGAPVVIRDGRGRFSRTICSDSCKTLASKQRRTQAISLAAQNVPVEEAIERIGEEYADSIRRWYDEAHAVPAP